MGYEAKLKELGVTLPDAPKPVAAYIPAVAAGNLVFTSGQLPVAEGALKYIGKIGQDLTQEEGYQAARICALNCLAAVRSLIGSLDHVQRVVQLNCWVNSANGFVNQPEVANGASELLLQVFGEAGRHARAAVGAPELPRDAAVEVSLVVQIAVPA